MNYIPKELLNIILEYDGRIKYRKGYYVNIIHKLDYRYNIIESVIIKKLEIIKQTEISDNIIINNYKFKKFYFDISFDKYKYMGLCYEYGTVFFEEDKTSKLEICFYNLKNNNIIQERTFI